MNASSELLSGRLLARNVVWNLAGAGLPLVVALWAIPRLVVEMGTERFGLLGIVWAAIGYLGLFDLGIGAALAKLSAERIGMGATAEVPELLRTGLRLLLALGVLAALVVASAAPWLVTEVFVVREDLVEEALASFWILAASLPIVTVTSGLAGILRARQRFDQINLVRIPLGIATFVAPVLALLVTPSLTATTASLACSRLLAWLAYRQLCRPYLPVFAPARRLRRDHASALIGFGGWLTVSNIVGPVMVYFDRFLIGATAGMTAVAQYATPYELVTRLWLVPDALLGVVFPALTMALAADRGRARSICGTAVRGLALAMSLPLALVMLLAPEGLGLWLGPAFADEGVVVLRWLAVGVFVNSFARLPFAALQAAGRPDLTAKLHLAEVLPYLWLLWQLTAAFGIAGTAMAWTLRILADTVALFAMAHWQVPVLRQVGRRGLAVALVGSAGLGLLALLDGSDLKMEAALGLVSVWGFYLARERQLMRDLLPTKISGGASDLG